MSPMEIPGGIKMGHFKMTSSGNGALQSYQPLTFRRTRTGLNGASGVVVILCSVVSYFLQPHGQRSLVGYSPLDFPGKNIGAGCHFLLQEIFATSSPLTPALAGRFFTTEPTGKHLQNMNLM